MKNKRLILPVTIFAVLLSFGLAACGGGGGEGGGESTPASQQSQPKQEVIKITAAGDKKTLIKGDTAETVQLTAKVGDEVLEGVKWESDKPEVATVSDAGLVTAVGVGSAKITASKDGYKTGNLTIKVELEKIEVTAAGETTLLAGQTVQLSANKQGVTWKTSDEKVATVSDAGLVTGVAFGSATISAEKEGYAAGSVTVSVVRPAPTATLHMEDADHYTADGVWGTSYSGTMYGPGEDSPVYARSSGNASDGTCIAYMDNGDQEILTFTSSAAVKAELVMMMASRNAVSDMSAVMTVTINGDPIALSGKEFAGGGDTNTFVEFSFGDVNIKNGENKLQFDFLGSSPYMDDLNIYAESAATIAVVKPAAKPDVTVDQESITVKEGKTAQITSSLTGLSYKSASESVATVSDTGLVTGIKVGTTTITVAKEGYKAARIPVTVTEAEGVIALGINEGSSPDDVVKTRTSQNLTAPYNYIVDEWPVGAVLTFNFTVEITGPYNLMMKARASGGYNSTTTDVLADVMELKINGNVVPLTQTVSGSFAEYDLGVVNLTAGPATMTIEAKGTVPTINMFRFVPNAQ